ncbi:MAG: DUF885 family protein [Proteobacteria bacterium]|nr:DUF885 family protein [Pseudomonadota bacterium]
MTSKEIGRAINSGFPYISAIKTSPSHRCLLIFLIGLILSPMNLSSQTPLPPASSGSSSEESVRKALSEIYEKYWEFKLETSPSLAAEYGNKDAEFHLAESGVATIDRDLKIYFELQTGIYALDLNVLPASEQQQAKMLLMILETKLDGIRVGTHLTPINQRRGPQMWLPRLSSQMKFLKKRDFEAYLSRLQQVPRYISGFKEILEKAVADGFLPPAVTLQGVLDQFSACTQPEVKDSLFYNPFRMMPPGMTSDEWQLLCQRAQTVISDEVVPALRSLSQYLEESYIPLCRDSFGAYMFPTGSDYYGHCIRQHTTTGKSATQIHQLGLREVARIRSQMQEIIKEVEFDGDFGAFVAHLRNSPEFYHPSSEELLKGYRDICKRADARLPDLFGKLPRAPYGVREIPAHEAPRATTAYYMSPPADGSQPGWFYANTYDLRSRPIYEMEALALHEAVPGHHLQLALQGELEGLPKWRKTTHFTAYIEGWGLYAESLGTQMGFYKDPYSRFGKLSYEMWRALRLVVDTGIHELGWSRAQAIQVMKENSALTEKNIEAEVDRYIAWPGQALAYKIGELEIQSLVKEARESLREKFDIRGFHDHMLKEGSMPLQILRTRMESWVEQQSR